MFRALACADGFIYAGGVYDRAARAAERPGGASVRVLHGGPEQAIAAHVAAGAGLLVMGAFGHGRVRAPPIGGTATAPLRACRVPVPVFR